MSQCWIWSGFVPAFPWKLVLATNPMNTTFGSCPIWILLFPVLCVLAGIFETRITFFFHTVFDCVSLQFFCYCQHKVGCRNIASNMQAGIAENQHEPLCTAFRLPHPQHEMLLAQKQTNSQWQSSNWGFDLIESIGKQLSWQRYVFTVEEEKPFRPFQLSYLNC